MITPRELRIGNLLGITVACGMPVVVDQIRQPHKNDWFVSSFNSEGRYNFLIREYNPIPLTTEWLERAGIIDPDGVLDIHESICVEISLSDKSVFIGSSYAVNHGYGAIVKCEYVHQLQNLYFSLTGKELEFKEI